MNPPETTQKLIELGWNLYHSDALLEFEGIYVKPIVGDWHLDGGAGIAATYKAKHESSEFLSGIVGEINEYLYGPDKLFCVDPILRVIIEALRYAVYATRPTRSVNDDKVLFEFELWHQNNGDVILIVKSEIYESNADRVWLISRRPEVVNDVGLGGIH